jgi:ankyrin repeat protein
MGASYNGCTTMAEILLRAGADVNSVNLEVGCFDEHSVGEYVQYAPDPAQLMLGENSTAMATLT